MELKNKKSTKVHIFFFYYINSGINIFLSSRTKRKTSNKNVFEKKENRSPLTNACIKRIFEKENYSMQRYYNTIRLVGKEFKKKKVKINIISI